MAIKTDNRYSEINRVLSAVIGDILRAEEAYLSREFVGLSSRELHVIEAVCSSMKEGTPHASADIAAELRITAGTLTTSVSQLEKKGYLLRQRDAADKRIVRITATDKGIRANERHMAFHQELVGSMLASMDEDEAAALITALLRIDSFFKDL